MRILDIITHSAERIIGQADNGFLYWSKPHNPDPFRALVRATLDPEGQQWAAWNVGDADDIAELVTNLKKQAIREYGFPYRPKNPLPA
jgi:hypothetical protein